MTDKYNELRQGYIEWLGSEEFNWNWFATFTTPHKLTMDSARRCAERYFEKMQIEGQDIRMFWVTEPYANKTGVHIHALIEAKMPWDHETLKDLWQIVSVYKGQPPTLSNGQVWNICHVRKYRKKKGAEGYLSKYMMKSYSEYGILTV